MFTMAMRVLTAALSFLIALAATAQTPPPQPAPAAQGAAPSQQTLTDAQLDALASPIALYPELLSEVLMASTYPLEIVEADRWVQSNKSLKVDQLKAGVDQQSWDDS